MSLPFSSIVAVCPPTHTISPPLVTTAGEAPLLLIIVKFNALLGVGGLGKREQRRSQRQHQRGFRKTDKARLLNSILVFRLRLFIVAGLKLVADRSSRSRSILNSASNMLDDSIRLQGRRRACRPAWTR